jgi:hypothetical protein
MANSYECEVVIMVMMWPDEKMKQMITIMAQMTHESGRS